MEIFLNNISHKYIREWVFRNLTFSFTAGNSYAILGSNGTGKSTLLQIVSGYLRPSEGKILYRQNESIIPEDRIFRYIAITAPYIELIEEFTLPEMISFHRKFRNFRKSFKTEDLTDIIRIGQNGNKSLKYFSSGMKQRVKLALAILSDVPVVLLDEPATNLDDPGISWYRNLLMENAGDRIIIICSNSRVAEYDFCSNLLQLDEYRSGLQR